MALGATIYRFEIELSDVSRGVYETLDVRAAMHPSESARHLVARVLAYCLSYEEGIAFGRGVSTADEPALWIKNLRGDVTTWIEIGAPSIDRLHKASKTGARVVVFAHRDVEPLLRELATATVHKKEDIAIFELPAALLDALEPDLDRLERWSLTSSDGALYLTRRGTTLEGTIERRTLG
jgi:uncharacterized protein YaeQ